MHRGGWFNIFLFCYQLPSNFKRVDTSIFAIDALISQQILAHCIACELLCGSLNLL